VNALSFLALIVLAIGIVVAYRTGVARGSRDGETEGARLRREIADHAAESWQMRELAEDRRELLRAVADSRDETARYRQLLIDLENNALPLLLDSPGAPDDLKLIVGIGPVLERMLQQLGINSYRQIARWTDRDIEEFNARLPDFPGRIRRDAWVTQARSLHQSKYGESLTSRERG
jgi:predicted flap endonuclease-1-like 5' DNA nuclease